MKKIIIGIDFAKEKFDVAVIVADGLEELAPVVCGQFENTKQGYRQLVSWVKKTTADKSTAEWLFCGEDTGACHKGLATWLESRGCFIWIVNAYHLHNSLGLNRNKNDKTDSIAIARFAKKEQLEAVAYKSLGKPLQQLREMYLLRRKFVKMRAGLMARQQDKKLSGSAKLCSEIELSTKRMIDNLTREIKTLEEKMRELVAADQSLMETFEIITSMKGLGLINAVALIVYTDNFTRFEGNARKIACYYGVAPFDHQSGKMNGNSHVSCLANKDLKGILSNAATVSIQYCPEMAAYYERLIAKGKNKWLAKNNVKNKILQIIVAMVTKKKKYDPNVYAEHKGMKKSA